MERRKGKEPIELGDDSSTSAVIALSDTDSVGSTACITGGKAAGKAAAAKLRKAFEKVTSKSAAKVKKVTKDLVGERTNQQVLDKGKDVVDKGKDVVETPPPKSSLKEKKVVKDLLGERTDQKALDKEKSTVLQIFTEACPKTVEEHLAAQFKKTSPGLASERIILRYLEHGFPKAKKAPQQDPKPGMLNS